MAVEKFSRAQLSQASGLTALWAHRTAAGARGRGQGEGAGGGARGRSQGEGPGRGAKWRGQGDGQHVSGAQVLLSLYQTREDEASCVSLS